MNYTPSEIAALILENRIAEINIAIPAEIVSYDFTKQKASVKPLLNDKYNDDSVKTLPIINGVPVQFCGNDEAIIHYPIKKGLKVFIVFSQRSLEEWLTNGKEVSPDDPRINDLTDAVVIVGQLKPFNVVSLAENNDDMFIKFKTSKVVLTKAGNIEMTTANVSINAEKTTVNGDLEVTGKVDAAGDIKSSAGNIEATAGDVVATAKSFLTHTHSGVTVGGGNTGGIV